MITTSAKLVIWFVFGLGAACLSVGAYLAIVGNAAYKDFLAIGVPPVLTGLFGVLARTRPDPTLTASTTDSAAKVDPDPSPGLSGGEKQDP